MKIALCHSMHFAEAVAQVVAWFAARGHEAMASGTNHKYIGLSDAAKDTLKLEEKYHHDAIRAHWPIIESSDAVLVLNYDKHGISGYVGGNAFLEMGFAHILNKPLYLLNPIPEMPYYHTEMVAMRPIVVHGDLTKVVAP